MVIISSTKHGTIKTALGDQESNLLHWRAQPLPREDNRNIDLLQQNQRAISTKLVGIAHPLTWEDNDIWQTFFNVYNHSIAQTFLLPGNFSQVSIMSLRHLVIYYMYVMIALHIVKKQRFFFLWSIVDYNEVILCNFFMPKWWEYEKKLLIWNSPVLS